MKNKPLKSKVESLVLGYMALFKEEYAAAVPQLSAEREQNRNKFASVSHGKTINRKIYAMPETLHNIILNQLTLEEIMQTKDGESGKDFANWFATRFPEFAAGTHV